MNAKVCSWVLTAVLCCAPAAHGAATPESVVLPAPDARPALHPELASDGRGNFLLVWQQGRNYFEQQESDIFALRLDGAGRPVGQPIPVCVAAGNQERPKVIFANGVFIVVWHDLRNGRDWDVYAARVGVDGAMRDANSFLVAGGAANQASPAIAVAPAGALVLWQHYAGRYYEIHGAFVGASGKGGAARALAFRGETLHGGNLSLASFGDRWVMSWKDERKWSLGESGSTITRYFASLRPNGSDPAVLDVERAPAATLSREGGRFASDLAGSALYTAWGDIGRGQRISVGAVFGAKSAAALANPNAEPELRASSWNPRQAMTLFSTRIQIDGPVVAAFGDGAFLVAARQTGAAKPPYRSRILGSRLSPAGVRLDSPDKLLSLHETGSSVANPALAAGPEGFVLVFEQDDGPEKQRLVVKSVRLR
ncbi:hypothetical protein [Aromatoleum bremense]|uniref:Uncharacterized protein n=1 Tax=Aromatoleum bremense TaxID=76115 RepID=A0ABX1NX34_9RHOO|nr:hypothetical protein [Aromatoleum bremense]NMG16536.1 hypothetical protein [Aromatoleum bremense]QTQ32797.1 Uncharacterized protein pbN1_28090 [Aromatoleum bremense]